MTTLVIALILLSLVFISIGHFYNADIYFSPIIGVMVGGLFSVEHGDDYKGYTLQVCLFFLCVTVIWDKPIG